MKTQQLLTSIAEAVFSQAGERFFHSLVELLASTLQVRFSFMCHMPGHNSMLFESFAFWGDKKNQGGIHRRTLERLYEKNGTGEKMIGTSDIQSLFPDDPWIWNAGIQICCMIPLLDNAGNLLGLLGVFDDKPLEEAEQAVATLEIFAVRAAAEIERQRAEQRLQESEDCLRAIGSAALCGIIMMDNVGCISFWNEKAEQMFGYTQAEAIGKKLHLLIAPWQYHAAIAKSIEAFITTGQCPMVGKTLQLDALRKDRAQFPIELSVSSVRVRGSWHALGVVQDITERKQADEEIKRSHQQLRQLTAHLQTIREQERTVIAREIHDELGQTFTALKMDLVRIQKRISTKQRELHAIIDTMLKTTDASIGVVQRISSTLRPALLDDLGLLAAMEWLMQKFQERTGIRCILSLPEELNLESEKRTALFRIFQEAITNVARHADASQLHIDLGLRDNWLNLRIFDNGKGISDEDASNSSSLGLLGLRERAHVLNGKVTIQGNAGAGTTVRVEIPLSEKEGEVFADEKGFAGR